MTPKRIQLSRKKGFNLQSASLGLNGLQAVNCARPSKWGNPFKVGQSYSRDGMKVISNWEAVRWFRKDIAGRPIFRAQIKRLLRGKNLACWCKIIDEVGNYVPCHADVLLEIANK